MYFQEIDFMFNRFLLNYRMNIIELRYSIYFIFQLLRSLNKLFFRENNITSNYKPHRSPFYHSQLILYSISVRIGVLKMHRLLMKHRNHVVRIL